MIMKKLFLFQAIAALVAVFVSTAASSWTLREGAGYLLGEKAYVLVFHW
jgi:hypothetical protein